MKNLKQKLNNLVQKNKNKQFLFPLKNFKYLTKFLCKKAKDKKFEIEIPYLQLSVLLKLDINYIKTHIDFIIAYYLLQEIYVKASDNVLIFNWK